MVRHATRGMTHTHTDQRACAGTVWCRVRLYGRLLSESESRCGVRVKAALDCSVLFSQYRGGVPGPNAFCSRTLGTRTRVCRVDFEIMSFGSVMTCAGRALRVVSRLPPGPETSKA